MSSFVVTFIAILSFFIISGCGSSGGPSDSSLYALSPSSSKNISGTTGDSKSPVMALDTTGDVYMAWMDKTPGHFEVYFSKSADGGWTFSEPFSVFKTSGSSEDPRMVKDGRYGKIHLAWINTTQVPSRELVYSHSQDKGGTFSRPRALSNVDTSSVSEMTISIDRFSNLLLAWVGRGHEKLLQERTQLRWQWSAAIAAAEESRSLRDHEKLLEQALGSNRLGDQRFRIGVIVAFRVGNGDF